MEKKGRLATILERDTNTEREIERETETEGGKGERDSKKMKVTKQRRKLQHHYAFIHITYWK